MRKRLRKKLSKRARRLREFEMQVRARAHEEAMRSFAAAKTVAHAKPTTWWPFVPEDPRLAAQPDTNLYDVVAIEWDQDGVRFITQPSTIPIYRVAFEGDGDEGVL